MRLLVFNCLLLASVAVALPNGRQQRDLAYLKNSIASAIFGQSQIDIKPAAVLQEENEYKLFRLPGYDDVMIKVAPKKPVVEELVYPPAVETANLNAFGTVIGTKSKDETLMAVKEVNNLLSTGILYGGQNNVMKQTVVPMFPSLNTPNYVLEEKIKTAPVIETTPVLTEVIETRPVLTEVVETRPVLTEVVETKPDLTEVIRPVEEKVELIVPFEPTYSYEPIQNKSAMTYTAHNNPEVDLVETMKAKTELPMFIKKRIDEDKVLGADPNKFAPVQEVFQYQSPPVVDFLYPRVENAYVQNSFREEVAPVQEVFQYQSLPVVEFSYPRVGANAYVQHSLHEEVAPVQEVYQYQGPSFVAFSYPRVKANLYVQNPFRKDLTKEFNVTNGYGLKCQKPHKHSPTPHPNPAPAPLKDSPVRYNLRPTKTIAVNPRPNPLPPHKSLHSEENISASKDKVNPPTRKVQVFNNLGEKVNFPRTLGQYIARVTGKGRNSILRNRNMKHRKAVPIVSSKDNVSNAKIPINVYKLQSNPNTGKMAKDNNTLRTNVKPNTNQYVNGPAVNSGNAKNDTAQIKNVVYTNKIAAKPQNVTHPVVEASTNEPGENIQTSIILKPTKDNNNYSNQQKNVDGYSLNVNDNKHGVSVSVKENNSRGRGDIPGSKM